jgi:hypothetical protein
MIKVNKQPVIGNYDTFDEATYDYTTKALVPVFELEIDNVPTDDYIKTGITWDSNESNNNTKRIPIFELDTETKKELEPLLEQFNEDGIMNMLDELATINPNMFNYWGYDKSKPASLFFRNNLDINISLVKDKPTNVFDPHFDGRNTFGTMIVNLTDNIVGTQFFDYGAITDFYKKFKETGGGGMDWHNRFANHIIYEAPKQKGKGIFFVNCETTFHGVGVDSNSDKERYALMVMLNLKLK